MPKTKKKIARPRRCLQSSNPPKSVWKGPQEDGITQSLLSRFLVCRERFRLLVVAGLQPTPEFNHRLEFGNMWHLCEENHACQPAEGMNVTWDIELKDYAKNLCKQYPLQQEQIQHWYDVCKIQFPVYLDYWSKRKSRKHQECLLQEETFSVPYKLPSGCTVKLRGKWDGVSLVGKGRGAGIYLNEHKTKGDVKEEQIKRQLQFDLQTMLYLVALTSGRATYHGSREIQIGKGQWLPSDVKGVIYNVVRRPLAGGKHSIRRLKPTKKNPAGESAEAFYGRLGKLIAEEPEWYFMRWQVEVTPADLERFKREFLNPALEQLCVWWEWIENATKHRDDPFSTMGSPLHYRTPYGIWNILAQGGSHELDEYLATGSTLGLGRTNTLFGELE